MRDRANPRLVVLAVANIAFFAVGANFVGLHRLQSAVSRSPEMGVPAALLTLLKISADHAFALFSGVFAMVAAVAGGRASAPSSALWEKSASESRR
jgi:hypothetical protein